MEELFISQIIHPINESSLGALFKFPVVNPAKVCYTTLTPFLKALCEWY
jgi:hypothetical protein